MLIPLLLLAKLLECTYKSGYLPRGKPQHSDLVEVVDPFKWAPTTLWIIQKGFHNLRILWMCICRCPSQVTAAPVGQAFGSYLQILLPAWGKPQCRVVVVALDPFKWGPTPMSNMHKMFHNNYKLWMCICMSLNHVSSALFGQDIGFAWYNKSGYLPRGKPQHSEVAEAVDPIKCAPASL